MLIVRHSNLMRKKPSSSSRVLNVMYRHQREKEASESRAKLFSKLWLKASISYHLKNKRTETNNNYFDDHLWETQDDLYLSNNKGFSEMKENELIYAVSFINLHVQKTNTFNHQKDFKLLNFQKDKKYNDHTSILDKFTYDILYKTLGEHIEDEKEKIY